MKPRLCLRLPFRTADGAFVRVALTRARSRCSLPRC